MLRGVRQPDNKGSRDETLNVTNRYVTDDALASAAAPAVPIRNHPQLVRRIEFGYAAAMALLLVGCTAPNPATSCTYAETSPQDRAGDAYCAVEPGDYADKILHLSAEELDLDLLMTPSTEPPSVAFALTLRAPAIACPLTAGSWVTDDGSAIAAHIRCGAVLLEFSLSY